MNIKLNSLSIKNFKGLKNFTLDINGNNASVFADNGKGKTTLMDAFLWLLFNKDSNDSTNFTVKPQDSLGQDINHLQTEVEAELLVDGKPLKLKKMQEEKWVKRHGATERVFDGHSTSYWFNEVPCKATEYKVKVDDLINENIFKMITNPLFFNTKLKWEERRKILLEISGDATDEQVIASDESLGKLTGVLNGRSIDDYKLVIADQLKNYKKERDNLPPRIDELTMSLPQEEVDYSAVETELKKHKDELATVEFLMTNATNKANKVAEKYQELGKLKNQLKNVKEKIKSESGADRTKLIEKKSELESGYQLLVANIYELKRQIESNKRTLENNESRRTGLLKHWHELDAERKKVSEKNIEIDAGSENCPACNQSLPLEILEGKKQELEARAKQEKEKQLKDLEWRINDNVFEGKGLKEDTEKRQLELKLSERELKDKEFKLENLKISINALDEELSKPIPEPDYSTNDEYTMIANNIEKLQTELDKPVEDKSTELLARKAEIQAKIDELNKVLNGKEEIEKKKARIEELKTEEKRVSALIAELEGHKVLLERFTVTKVNLLEDSINSQFKHVKFKLFEENVTNDGIKETCIALVNTNGAYVKFEDANSAGKINAGIDCINALCKFYGVTTPLWIDNRESVVKLADTDSQVISLVVSEKDKELRVEVQG
jgi:exonuclease SbcC